MERLGGTLFNSRIRRVVANDREYFVAPVRLIVPGVLNGSKGPLYYPPDEVARNYQAWNGMPLVVYHPDQNGSPVSGRDPDVLHKQGVGHLYRVKPDTERVLSNGKRVPAGALIGEGWFDALDTKRVNQEVYRRLLKGDPIEVSTGLFTDNEPAPPGATHNDTSYAYVARNHRPDHLAILPDQAGACSLNDGCGVNLNAEGFASDEQRRAFFGLKAGGEAGEGRDESTTQKIEETPGHFAGRYKVGEKYFTSKKEAAAHIKAQEKASQPKPKEPEPTKAEKEIAETVKESKEFLSRGSAALKAAGLKEDAKRVKEGRTPQSEKGKEILRRELEASSSRVKKHVRIGNSLDLNAAYTFSQEDCPECGAKLEGDPDSGKCNACGYEWGEKVENESLTRDERSLLERFMDWFTRNATIQPHSKNTGRFKTPNAGTGKGEVHEAAQKGYMTLTEEDRELGKQAAALFEATGHNPAEWVQDEGIWERAKKAAEKYAAEGNETYYAVVTHIYKNMGGTIKGQTKNELAPNITPDTETPENSEASQGDADMATRTDNVQWLVMNCDCWKGKDKVLQNKDAFSDEEVIKLRTNAEGAKRNELVANAAIKTLKEEGYKVIDTSTLNEMPAFIKEKIKKKKGEEEDEEEEMPKKKRKKIGIENADPDEDDDDDEDEDMDKKTENRRPLTEQEWLEQAPQSIRSVVRNAMAVERRERESLVNRIVANRHGDDRTRRIETLKGKSLEDLKEIWDDIQANLPAHNAFSLQSQEDRHTANYLGGAGGGTPTQDLEILDLPVMNEELWARKDR